MQSFCLVCCTLLVVLALSLSFTQQLAQNSRGITKIWNRNINIPAESFATYEQEKQLKNGISSNRFSQSTLASTVGELRKNSRNWISLMSSLQQIDNVEWQEINFLPLISLCVSQKRSAILQELFELMISRKVSMTAKSFSIFLRGFALARNVNMINFLLKDLVERKLTPDTILLNTILDSLIRCGDKRRAESIFTALATGHQTSSSYTKDDLLEYLKLCSTNIDIWSINTILKSYAEKGVDECFRIMDIVAEKKLRPDSVTINTLLSACIKHDDFRSAHLLLQSEENRKIVGIEGYQVIVHGLAKSGNVNLAFDLVKQMYLETSIQPNSHIFSSILQAGLKTRQFSMCKDILHNIEKHLPGIATDSKIALFNAYVTAQLNLHEKLSRSLVDDVPQRRLQITRSVGLIEGQLALWEMARNNWPLEAATVNALLAAVLSLKRPGIDGTSPLLRYFEQTRREPNEVFYTILFTALGNFGKPELALTLYHNISSVYSLDVIAMNSVFSSLRKNRQSEAVIGFYFNLTGTNLFVDSRDASSSNVSRCGLLQPDVVTFTELFLSLIDLCRSSSTTAFSQLPREQPVLKADIDFSMDERTSLLLSSLRTVQRDVLSTTLSSTGQDNPLLTLLQELGTLNIYEFHDEPNSPHSQNIHENKNMEGFKLFENTENELLDFENVTSFQKLLEKLMQRFVNYDGLIHYLYKDMRNKYNVKVDIYLLRILNTLFSTYDKATSRSARSIFEDLIVQGYHPRDMTAIFEACDFSRFQKEEYMNVEKLSKLRKSQASHQIFNRHGWNRMESGWRPF